MLTNEAITILLFPVLVPAACGVVCACLPKRRTRVGGWLAEAALVAAAAGAIHLFASSTGSVGAPGFLLNDALARTMCLVASIMALLIMTYSLSKALGALCSGTYCACFLLTVALANATFFCDNLLVLAILWGSIGITLFLLINLSRTDEAATAAKKTLIIIGGTDSLLIIGLGLLWMARGGGEGTILTLPLLGSKVATSSGIGVAAFLCLLSAALAKAGAFPFHTWVPDCAKAAPTSVSALLPAALDKLLGIYLVYRLVIDVFQPGPGMQITLLAIGAFTIVAAVFMALIQHDLKRLLGYHAVSQVGYMVLGIATLTPVGILGGMFHMVNNVIYKGLLFLGAGAVESRTGTTNLDRLGGLGRRMPMTFLCMTVAALAISGVPPLNGFMSKWLVYQGVIELGPKGGLWIVWLTAAMFGSALTLASFVKVLHAVFLARPKAEASDWSKVREVGPAMLLPMGILAIACVLFGVLAWSVPIRGMLARAVNVLPWELYYMRPVLVMFLLIVPLLIGAAIYGLSKLKVRRDAAHIGGERYDEEMKLSGTDFYETVVNLPVLRVVYRLAEKKWFDVYEVGQRLSNYITAILRAAHQGYLYVYVTWCVLGLAVLIWLFLEL